MEYLPEGSALMVRLNPALFVIRMVSPGPAGTVPWIVPVVACPHALPERPIAAEPMASATALWTAVLRWNRGKYALFMTYSPIADRWVRAKGAAAVCLYRAGMMSDPMVMRGAGKPHSASCRRYSPVSGNH